MPQVIPIDLMDGRIIDKRQGDSGRKKMLGRQYIANVSTKDESMNRKGALTIGNLDNNLGRHDGLFLHESTKADRDFPFRPK